MLMVMTCRQGSSHFLHVIFRPSSLKASPWWQPGTLLLRKTTFIPSRRSGFEHPQSPWANLTELASWQLLLTESIRHANQDRDFRPCSSCQNCGDCILHHSSITTNHTSSAAIDTLLLVLVLVLVLVVVLVVVVVVVVVVLVVLVVVVFVVVVALGLLLRDLAVPDRSSTPMRNMGPTLGTTPQAEFFINHLPRTWSGRSRSMTRKPLQHLEMKYPKLELRLPFAQIREFNGTEVQVFFCLFRHTRTLKCTSPQCCGHRFAAANRLVAFRAMRDTAWQDPSGSTYFNSYTTQPML